MNHISLKKKKKTLKILKKKKCPFTTEPVAKVMYLRFFIKCLSHVWHGVDHVTSQSFGLMLRGHVLLSGPQPITPGDRTPGFTFIAKLAVSGKTHSLVLL